MVIIYLAPMLPSRLCGLPVSRTKRVTSCSSRCFGTESPHLFGLAPGGVYRASDVTAGPVSSYLAFSPLPRIFGAVCFLWHFPSSRSRSFGIGTPPISGAPYPVEPGLSSLFRWKSEKSDHPFYPWGPPKFPRISECSRIALRAKLSASRFPSLGM